MAKQDNKRKRKRKHKKKPNYSSAFNPAPVNLAFAAPAIADLVTTRLDNKSRRSLSFPKKIHDLITLPAGNDFTSFRDEIFYSQFIGEAYRSSKWPDEAFGDNLYDIIKIDVFTGENEKITTKYLSNDQFESVIDSDITGMPAVIKIDTGEVLRDMGFRKGRFSVKMNFYRLMAGSPFPLLVNDKEKIYKGEFLTEQSTGYFYATNPHNASETEEGDRLYVKENKFIISDISADKSEIILSPNFIDDEEYLERFRLAAYNCLNWFPSSSETVGFDGEDSNYITINSVNDIPTSFVNGTIRVNNAYFMGKRIIPEERIAYEVTPTIELSNQSTNLLKGRTLKDKFGWKTHAPWPDNETVNSLSLANPNLTRIENVILSNPTGQLGIKQVLQTTINDLSRSSTNLALYTVVRLDKQLEGQSFTFSIYSKLPEGVKVRLVAHSGTWGVEGTTTHSPLIIASGKWERLDHTFILTNTKENKIQVRCEVFPNNVFDPSDDNNIGTEFYWAGAQLESGTVMTKFTLNESQSDSIVETASSGIIQFDEPDGQILTATIPATDTGFLSKMAGYQIQIEDAIAIDDLSNVYTVNDVETKNVFNPGDMYPTSGETGRPGNYHPHWDDALHGQSIIVTNDLEYNIWSSGFLWFANNSRWNHAGTQEIGYHAQWHAKGGVDNNAVMYFPDLNYQDYILEPMKSAALSAWNSDDGYYTSRGLEDPRVSRDDTAQEWFKHRKLAFSSKEDALGSLASYGIMSGDTVRLTWQQKSIPKNYDFGKRKGARVGVHHYVEEVLVSPNIPIIDPTELSTEQFLIGGANIDLTASIKPVLPPEGIETAPENGPTENKPNRSPDFDGELSNGAAWRGFHYYDEFTAEEGEGDLIRGWNENVENEMWSWSRTGGWQWSGALDDKAGTVSIGYDVEGNVVEAFGWTWDGTRWTSNYIEAGGVFLAPNSSGILQQVNNYPSYDTKPTDKNISEDMKFTWDGNHWVYLNQQTNSGVTTDDDGVMSVSSKRATFDLPGDETTTLKYVECEGYNDWEIATHEFIIDDTYSLKDLSRIYIFGHHGDFGELWVDKIKLEVVLTSNDRTAIDESAKLAPLILEIDEVLSRNRIKVTQTYEEAAVQQGHVLSNFSVNQFSSFDKGFSVGYIDIEEGEDLIYARYEGKVLDVINESSSKKIIVDKSYKEYGEIIGAISASAQSESIDISVTEFDEYFIRYRLNDPDNLYTKILSDSGNMLVTNFKPVNSENYPGSIAYKLSDKADNISKFDTVFIAREVTPELNEKIDLVPFIDELVPDTVLRAPKLQDLDSPISDRPTSYLSHTDLVGNQDGVKKQLEDKLISGSLENVSINIDYTQFENFSHFGSVERRIENFRYKLRLIKTYNENSQSLAGELSSSGYLQNSPLTVVSSSTVQAENWNLKKRQTINSFDDFENYMYFKSSSYVSSSNGIFYDNAAPKASGDGTLTSPYSLYSVSSSQFTSWYDGQIESGSIFDRQNLNRLINLLPSHITYDTENSQFITFMDMMGHHYDIIWTHIRALTDVHDRSEDITKGISAQLVQPIAESLGFEMLEGRGLVSLPQYHLGLQESGSGTGIYNVRFSKRSQKDVSREIWNRILATMPYILKSKGTKQSLKALIAAYGIPTSILRIQEYGGPKISGEPDFEIKQRFTKALHFKGGQYVQVPWYNTALEGRASDTIEFRFKTGNETDQIIASKNNSLGNIDTAIHLINVSGSDTKGKLTFSITGSDGYASASLNALPMYNNEFWSVMVRRRTGTLTSSYADQSITSDTTPATQSFDLFAGYYDSTVDEIITKASASISVSGSLLTNWYRTGSTAGDDRWHIGGRVGSAEEGVTFGAQLTGSLMEWRYWSTPLSESAFYNHVAAPKAINGNTMSSSYYDMNLRLSMDDNDNLNTNPYAITDYSSTDGIISVTGSSFNDEVNFISVSDRQKAFIPAIGLNKKSNKIRIESAKLKYPNGASPTLSTTERVELSSFDTSPNDSNKLGVFFAPSDVINEDIILSVANLDFGQYLGDPRDTYAERYFHGRLDRIADNYWKKWTTKQNFWDYIKLIKYYDLSLFNHLKKLLPARAKKNIGLLIEPTILERSKIVMGAAPIVTDEYRLGVVSQSTELTGSKEYRTSTLSSSFATSITGSNTLHRTGYVLDSAMISSSAENFLSLMGTTTTTGSFTTTREDYTTISSSGNVSFKTKALQKFGVDYHIDWKNRDYVTGSVHTGGGDNIFFEVLQPMATASRLSSINKEKIYFYSSSLSASKFLYYSSSLEPSDVNSLFTTHTALTRLAYDGCKEDGSTVPFGNELPVEIIETNPYDVKTSDKGQGFVDINLKNE